MLTITKTIIVINAIGKYRNAVTIKLIFFKNLFCRLNKIKIGHIARVSEPRGPYDETKAPNFLFV